MTHDTQGRSAAPKGGRPEPGGPARREPDPRRWIALVIILSAGFMDLLDVTIVNVVLPSILTDLDAEYAQAEWIVAGYVLGFAALLVTGGRLGDIFGRKRLFLVGVASFTAASALCGAATGPEMLIGARFLQGAMAGLMVPQILAIIHVSFPAEERGKVIGIWGGVMGSASAIGLVTGGALIEWNPADLGWRSIFLVNVPIGLAALIAAWFFVSESKPRNAPRVDLVGAVVSILGILLLVYPLTEGRNRGWPLWIFLLMGSAVVVLGLFVLYESHRTRTVGSPLVALSLFRNRAFSAGMTVWMLFWLAAGGFFLVWTLYMQMGLGWSALRAGLTSTAFAVGGATGSGLAVQVFTPRFGRKVLMGGAALNGAGFAAYLWAADHYGPDISSWQMALPLVVTGFGFGLVVAPMIDAILTGVPGRDAGSASGTLGMVQQVGMALGVALVGVFFFNQIDHDSDRGVDKVVPALQQQLTAAGVPDDQRGDILAGFRTCVRERSASHDPTEVPESCLASAEGGPARLGELLEKAGEEANAHNFSRSFSLTLWWGVGIQVLVFLGMFALPRHVRTGLEAVPAEAEEEHSPQLTP
ncbi:multidrug MFS transporter [Wenjunlia vitaminophila]|uniref:Multidrug MFS transporter n=1 Tax=Wenjunlia vitaminophila TaxID=76728 RepID=A0A0T6LU76_WENVI|nr:MFS transporter [Wenjunlia vitaminophila]KRV49556.1 multidrug MFS transporter [Wenjunlia vitaminophila]